MSYFISFESLIIPVYALCFCLDAVLLSQKLQHLVYVLDYDVVRLLARLV